MSNICDLLLRFLVIRAVLFDKILLFLNDQTIFFDGLFKLSQILILLLPLQFILEHVRLIDFLLLTQLLHFFFQHIYFYELILVLLDYGGQILQQLQPLRLIVG